MDNDHIHTQPYSGPCDQHIRQERLEDVLHPLLSHGNKLTGYWILDRQPAFSSLRHLFLWGKLENIFIYPQKDWCSHLYLHCKYRNGEFRELTLWVIFSTQQFGNRLPIKERVNMNQVNKRDQGIILRRRGSEWKVRAHTLRIRPCCAFWMWPPEPHPEGTF